MNSPPVSSFSLGQLGCRLDVFQVREKASDDPRSGNHATMDRPVTIQLADPGKFHFDKLRLEPDGLEIQGHGLPDIDHLREAGQS